MLVRCASAIVYCFVAMFENYVISRGRLCSLVNHLEVVEKRLLSSVEYMKTTSSFFYARVVYARVFVLAEKMCPVRSLV